MVVLLDSEEIMTLAFFVLTQSACDGQTDGRYDTIEEFNVDSKAEYTA